MATIDLIVLGILKKEPMGAYDIQKLVEYRNISKWVKISTIAHKMRLKTKKTLNTQLYLMECFAVSKKVVNFALCLE